MKLKIAIRILGQKPPDFDVSVLMKWDSSLWEVFENRIDTLALNGDADLPSWGYSDSGLKSKALPIRGADISIYILSVPLESNYYFRRIERNVGCVSLYEVADILRSHNIPIENLVLRMLYSSTLIYARKRKLPPISELAALAHHETKGCIFDMTGIKTDIVFSCDRPILCDSCRVDASEEQVTKEMLDTFSDEVSKIRKKLYYRLLDCVKRNPVLAIIVSLATAFMVNLASSYCYDLIK